MSDIDAMISEKKDFLDGSSGCSKHRTAVDPLAVPTPRSIKADSRMSHRHIDPREVLYAMRLHFEGWNFAVVMTSVNSSMFCGLMSTISVQESSKHIFKMAER
jgi:hypothetical protein